MPAGAILADALLPGSGLISRGRIGVGVALITAAGLAAGALALGVAGMPGFDSGLARSASAYLALGAAAALGGWLLDRGMRIDPAAVRAAHDEAAAAYLRGENPAALAAARRTTRLAPQEAGAWDLLALVARAAGDPGTATRAERRARALERRAASV